MIAVLVENTGNPEGPSGEKVGLYSAALDGSAAPITWRLMGDPGGTTLQDPVRGVMNAAGLYGSDNGWDLPGYPDQDWQNVTLPDSWAARGVPPGIGWYRTSFSLNLPGGSYVPIDVQIGGPGPGAGTADYRAFIYVNGWLIGRYVNNVGPAAPVLRAGRDPERPRRATRWRSRSGAWTPPAAAWTRSASWPTGNQAGGVPVAPGGQPRLLGRGVRAARGAAADAGRDLRRPRWPRARSRSRPRCATRPASRWPAPRCR